MTELEMLTDLLALALGVFTVGLFIWATKNHFNTEKMTARARAISACVVAETIILIWSQFALPQPLVIKLVGIAIMAFSLWLVFAAMAASKDAGLGFAFTDDKPQSVLRAGPYGWVRHPFYVAYILFWGGWSVAVAALWPWPIFILLVVLYWRAAAQEESKFAETNFAQDYARYRDEVGFFWPKLGR